MKIHPFHVKKEETGILDEQNTKEWILEIFFHFNKKRITS